MWFAFVKQKLSLKYFLLSSFTAIYAKCEEEIIKGMRWWRVYYFLNADSSHLLELRLADVSGDELWPSNDMLCWLWIYGPLRKRTVPGSKAQTKVAKSNSCGCKMGESDRSWEGKKEMETEAEGAGLIVCFVAFQAEECVGEGTNQPGVTAQ